MIPLTHQIQIQIEELDLLKVQFPHVNGRLLDAFHSSKEYRSLEETAMAGKSENAIQQIYNADIIIISTPMHNYTVPSALKAYLDHVVRAGITFGFTSSGPQGLFKNKKVYISFSAGWNFSSPELKPFDFCIPYLKAVLNLIGIDEIKVFRVEGATGAGKETLLHDTIKKISL